MGSVAVVFRIMPESAETNISELKSLVLNTVKAEDIGVEEIGFGLKAIKLSVIVKDEEGALPILEEGLRKIKGVGEVEVVAMDLL